MNLLLRELKAHRKSLLIWCICIFYIIAASMWKFGAEYSSNQSLNELVGLLNILLFNVVTLVFSIIMVGYFNHGDSLAAEIVKLMAGMFIIQLIFLLMGSAIAAYGKNLKISTPVAIVVVLVFLMIAKIADMSRDFDFLRWFTPIKYYEAELILGRGGFSSTYLLLSILILGLLTFITYMSYQKTGFEGLITNIRYTKRLDNKNCVGCEKIATHGNIE